MDIAYQYSKMRSSFGRQPMFCEFGPEMCDSIPVNEKEQKLYILRNPVHQITQNTPCFSENHINTIRYESNVRFTLTLYSSQTHTLFMLCFILGQSTL